jgi:AsmA protein
LKKALKILAIALGVLIVALVALAVTISLVVDPNDYKDEIIEVVKDNTGRDLKIEGDLQLSLFPWLGVEIAGVELANTSGFGQKPFAQVARAGVRLKVWPLLSRELMVDTVTLDGLVLNLMRNRAGATNWQDLRTTAPEQPKRGQEPAAPGAPAIGALTISGIKIRNGEIDWLDEASGAHYALHALTLSGGKIVPGQPVDLSLAFDLESGGPPVRVRIELATRATLDLAQQTLDVTRLALSVDELGLKGDFKATQIMETPVVQGKVEIAPFDPRALMKKLPLGTEAPSGKGLRTLRLALKVVRRLALQSQFKLDLGRQTLGLSGLRLSVDDMALSGDINASKFLAAPVVQGTVDVPPFNPRPLMTVLPIGLKLPAGKSLSKLALNSQFKLDLGRQTLAVSGLHLTVDDMALSGELKGSQILEKPALQGTVDIQPFNPRPFIKLLAPDFAPRTKNALTRASVKSDFKADLGGQTLNLSKLHLSIDDIALTANIKGSKILADPKFSGDLALPGFRPAAIIELLGLEVAPNYRDAISQVSVRTRFSADLGRDALDLAGLSLRADEIKLSGNVRARQLRKAPNVSGQVELQPLNLRSLMKKLGIDYQTADKRALTRVSVKSDFNGSQQHLTLTKLNTKLDQTTLAGSLKIRNFARPAYAFALTANQIDLDRYMPPPATAPAGTARGSAAPRTPGAGPPPVAIPLDTLRTLDLQGQLRANKLKAFGIRSANVAIKVNAKNGLLTLGPNQAKLYGGSYGGKTLIDARGKVPKFTMKEKLSQLKLGPFLTDTKITDKLSGTGSLSLDVSARGLDADMITKTVTGNLALSLRNGEIKGVDLQKIVNDIVTLTQDLKGQPPAMQPKPTDSTKFDSFNATLKIKNGLARNDDLRLQGPILLTSKKKGGLWASGKGTADLPKQTINYRLMVKFAEDASRKGTTIPIDIRGSFAEPQFKPDWNKFLEAQIKKKVDKKVEQKKQKLEDKLKKKLKDKFKF